MTTTPAANPVANATSIVVPADSAMALALSTTEAASILPRLAVAERRPPASVSIPTSGPSLSLSLTSTTAAAAEVVAATRLPALDPNTIPPLARQAYLKAALTEAHAAPNCGLSWQLLAGIGLVESNHARGGGSTNPKWAGVAVPPIFGPTLDGQHGYPAISDTDNGRLDGDDVFDRAVGPMQFLPATWGEYASKIKSSAVPNPENIFDAAEAAGRYLCASGVDLRTSAGVIEAVYGYNHSLNYVSRVVLAANRYADGGLPGAVGALTDLPTLAAATAASSSAAAGGATSAAAGPTVPVILPSLLPTPTAAAPGPPPAPTTSDPGTPPPATDSSAGSSPAVTATDSTSPDPTSADPTSASPTSADSTSASADPTTSADPSVSADSSAPQVTHPPAQTGRPSSGNTGVPAGVALTVFDGDLTASTAGAFYSGLDIHGFVKVEAPGVTIENCIIRGGVATSDTALVTDTSSAATGLLIEDSELVPASPSVYIDGIDGWNYTALRVDIHGTTDGAKIFGPNASVQHSYIHGLVTYAHDPDHQNGQSHNDDVQVLSGSNVRILSNDLEGGSNSAIQVTQDHGVLSDVLIDGNWADAGDVTINIANKPLPSLDAVTVTNNIFGRAATTGCQILYTSAVSINLSGNVYADSGLPAVALGTGA